MYYNYILFCNNFDLVVFGTLYYQVMVT